MPLEWDGLGKWRAVRAKVDSGAFGHDPVMCYAGRDSGGQLAIRQQHRQTRREFVFTLGEMIDGIALGADCSSLEAWTFYVKSCIEAFEARFPGAPVPGSLTRPVIGHSSASSSTEAAADAEPTANPDPL